MEEEKKTTTQQDFSQLNKLRGTTKSATTDEETVVSHLFTGMAAMYKQLQSHSEGRNALYSFLFFFFLNTTPCVHRSSNGSYRTSQKSEGRAGASEAAHQLGVTN